MACLVASCVLFFCSSATMLDVFACLSYVSANSFHASCALCVDTDQSPMLSKNSPLSVFHLSVGLSKFIESILPCMNDTSILLRSNPILLSASISPLMTGATTFCKLSPANSKPLTRFSPTTATAAAIPEAKCLTAPKKALANHSPTCAISAPNLAPSALNAAKLASPEMSSPTLITAFCLKLSIVVCALAKLSAVDDDMTKPAASASSPKSLNALPPSASRGISFVESEAIASM